jgi:hypothetical protein
MDGSRTIRTTSTTIQFAAQAEHVSFIFKDKDTYCARCSAESSLVIFIHLLLFKIVNPDRWRMVVNKYPKEISGCKKD